MCFTHPTLFYLQSHKQCKRGVSRELLDTVDEELETERDGDIDFGRRGRTRNQASLTLSCISSLESFLQLQRAAVTCSLGQWHTGVVYIQPSKNPKSLLFAIMRLLEPA